MTSGWQELLEVVVWCAELEGGGRGGGEVQRMRRKSDVFLDPFNYTDKHLALCIASSSGTLESCGPRPLGRLLVGHSLKVHMENTASRADTPGRH